jgi:hypothetical protein
MTVVCVYVRMCMFGDCRVLLIARIIIVLTPYLTMIPPISFAFVAALAFSGLNASVGYLTGILDIPVAQVILIRNVSSKPISTNSGY